VNEPSIPLWSSGTPPHLLASRERASGTLRFPPFPPASPLAALHDTVDVAPRGEVYSYSVIHPNPKTGAQPYALGYVDMPGPLRIFGRFADGAIPAVGEACEAVPDDAYGYQFTLQNRKGN
jgi:uncharacterized OB-fold protein